MVMIAEYRVLEGYFAMDPATVFFGHKNYFLAFLVSDLFYYSDTYVLNFMAINILSIFYSGILLALIASNIFNSVHIEKIRVVFYLTILQPIAWIPSHTMRDTLGAFLVIFSVALIYFSTSKLQKVFFSVLSLALVFQHRSAYAISMLGNILLRNFSEGNKAKWFGIFVTLILLLLLYFFISSDTGAIFLSISSKSAGNSLLSGSSASEILIHFISLITGPFPWTQYYDGRVTGHSGFYSSIYTLQAAWHLAILYFICLNIKKIFKNKKLRVHFYTIVLFAIPPIFSLGGMNIYLLPSLMLALIFFHESSLRRFFLIFSGSVSFYIGASALFYFSKF